MSTLTHTRLHYYHNIALKTMRELDRERTVVILPVGMVEEHGDHLPMGTDTYAVEAVSLAAATWLLDYDDRMQVLMLPAMPFGIDPLENRRPELFTRAGGIWLSADTLRRVLLDLIELLVGYGFRYIFPVSFHGGKDQIILLAQISDEVRAAHPGVIMYEPMAYIKAGFSEDIVPGLATLLGRPLTPAEEVTVRNSIHASMMETSIMLHLQPELVDSSYKILPTIEWTELYRMPDWPGYVGAGPRHANPDIGAAMLRWWGVRTGELIRRAMEGEDLSGLPRHPRWYFEEDEEPVAKGPAPVAKEPYIDTRPAMFIKSGDLAARLEEAQQQSAPPPRKADDTPRSSIYQTRPGKSRRKRAAGGEQPPPSEDDSQGA